MHERFLRADELSRLAIGAAIEVHRIKGPGLIESIYERCLMRELELQGIAATQQVRIPIEYKGETFEGSLRIDIPIEDHLVLELKAVEKVLPIHKAQLLSYMKILDAPLGLIINSHSIRLVEGVSRLILQGADKPD